MSDQTQTAFDVIVLGGGSSGYATALRCAQLDLTVALIEKDKLGGTCLHAGCIPTKALLHVAEVVEQIRHSPTLGIESSFTGVEPEGFHAFKNGVVERLHRGLEGLIAAAPGVSYVSGEGRITGSHSVEVDGVTFTAKNLVIATGSEARSLPGIELNDRVITSTEALELPKVPTSAVIIGGSVIGVEFASAWRSLGADVTIVEALPSLVPLEDPTLSKHLERAFRRRKIAFRTGAQVTDVELHDAGARVLLSNGEKIEADYVLVAVGRRPVTDGIGLENSGVEMDGDWIRTDLHLRTTVPGIYAVGDVVRGLQLAHRGFAHGIFVAEQIAGLSPRPIMDSTIARVTYSEPELASVGLTELEARQQFGDCVDIYEYNLGGNGKSQILQTSGLVKIVRGPHGDIVGVHMIGARIGEQVGEAGLMVNLGLRPEQVAGIVHAHPTQNEALGEAALALAGKPLHAHS